VEFNVAALQHAAEGAVGNKHGKVISISKLAEGGFNRVFTLGLEDGFELIAKIPYHIAVPRYYATASEAATLTFLRLKDVPVPEVYGYCADAENPVGTEYLFMEKAPGVCLKSKWLELSEKEISQLAQTFVQIELTLSKISFGATGSIYFKKDIASELQAPLYQEDHAGDSGESEFCTGPIADYMFWYGKRAGLDLNRGPWRSPADYLKSIAQKEIEWTKRYGKPMGPGFPHNTMGLGIQEPEDYLKLLESYQVLAPYLLPKDPKHSYNQPTLRHPDPAPGNIYISPETGRVTCLIDWQHTIVQPCILAAGYPSAFENPDDEMDPDLKFPQLPEDLASWSEHEKAAAQDLHRRRVLFHSYRVFNGNRNRSHLAALNDPLHFGRKMLVERASRQWTGDSVTLRGLLMRAVQYWEHLPDVAGIRCPIEFESSEREAFLDTEDFWQKMSIGLRMWHDKVGMSEEGWVLNYDYENAKQKLVDLKEEIWKQCEGDAEDEEWFCAGWPFRDREEVFW
jgi:aminoglycoside phosphotransferase (APT) family kinase protein